MDVKTGTVLKDKTLLRTTKDENLSKFTIPQVDERIQLIEEEIVKNTH